MVEASDLPVRPKDDHIKEEESSQKSPQQENDDSSDRYRMCAAISFVVMLLVVGVPLWWKTTQVERSSLPYQAIAALDPSRLTIASTIHIWTEYPSLYNSLRLAFLQHFQQHPSVLRVSISSRKLDLAEVSVATVEEWADKSRSLEPNSLLLVEVPLLPPSAQILLSPHRILYFTNQTSESVVARTVMEWMMEGEDLGRKMSSMLEPQGQSVLPEDESQDGRPVLTRLRAATSYHFVFSVVVSDPSRLQLDFDIKTNIQRYVEPLLEQLRELGEHRARSQWIHLLDLSPFSKDGQIIPSESLPHIITPLEKRLGSGVCGVAGCVQLVLYATPPCSPLLLGPPPHTLSITAPPWGSVQILNTPQDLCNNGTSFSPRPAPIMATFVSQIHSLLGFTNPEIDGVVFGRKIGPELRDWQLDSLYRMRTLQQLTSASLTLKSLSKLLGEISNIVINSEVGRCVEESVRSVEEGLQLLSNSSGLIRALRASQNAFVHAEKAFTDPSLLALLYFPDDQKYAVYIPLFLPIMIPVLMSLKPIYKWLVSAK